MAAIVPPVSNDYNVHIHRTEFVVPALPTDQDVIPLTNLDLTIPPVSVNVFFCYKNTSNRTFPSALSHLKTSLSRTLVGYYVFAGRLVTNSVGLPEILCKCKGVQFTEAYAPTRLAKLNMFKPDETVQGKLVPLLAEPSLENGSPVLSVQVTEFSCGGMILGCTFDHRVADAFSANTNCSKFEAFSAYFWRLLMHTQEVNQTKNCRIGIVVDGRSRLQTIGMSDNYFGNVLLLPFIERNAGDVKNKSISWGAGLIHDAISSAANDEHFQSLIDFVETTKPTTVLAKIYCKADDAQSTGPSVLLSSGLRFPLYEVDHGWGQPTFASYHFPSGGEAGYVMPSHSPVGDEVWPELLGNMFGAIEKRRKFKGKVQPLFNIHLQEEDSTPSVVITYSTWVLMRLVAIPAPVMFS
ncbi:hypothetical protein KI387_033796, partial [Taxus chinensis]